MEAKGSGLKPLTSAEYDRLKSDFSSVNGRESELNTDLVERTRMAVAFISQYTAVDILVGPAIFPNDDFSADFYIVAHLFHL